MRAVLAFSVTLSLVTPTQLLALKAAWVQAPPPVVVAMVTLGSDTRVWMS